MHRFIPAPAGNTRIGSGREFRAGESGSSPRLRGTRSAVILASVVLPVHPRACGEHRRPGGPRGAASRFIPAPAGNTGSSSVAPHPADVGSSPRLRGTRIRVYRQHRTRSSAVHPRACGEHVSRRPPMSLKRWRTVHPRALRGTHRAGHETDDADDRRFIPAPAGNTRDCQRAAWIAAHPGSSPRLRGTRLLRRTAALPRTVHPRACGEHCSSENNTLLSCGSSPRLRGTP